MTTEQAFFHLYMKNGQIYTQGVNHCDLGHTIASTSGKKPDGIYARWAWDGQRFTLTNDREGFYPLYYYWHDNELCVSHSIPTILKNVSNHEFDFEGLSVFLRLGFFLGNKTPFKYIKAVPPDAYFVWENSHLTVKGDIRIHTAIEITPAHALDQYIELFRQAIQRRLPDGEFISLLSGGRDSRHILLELNSRGYKPKFCVTTLRYPPYADDDIEKAAMVAQRLNFKHIVKYHTTSRLNNEIRSFRMCNFCSDEHSWIMDSLEDIRKDAPIVYDGIAGDITAVSLENPTHLDLMKKESFKELALQLFKAWGMAEEKTFQLVLDPDFYKKISLERAVESLAEELKKHTQAVNPANSFYYWNRTRREIALCPYGILDFPKVYSPYLDYDLSYFLWSLPLDLCKDRTLQSEVIQRMYPQYADIPFDVQKGSRQDTTQHYMQFTRDLAKHWIKEFKVQSSFLNMTYLSPRLLKTLADEKYCESSLWMSPLMMLYLSELEKEAA